MDYYEILQVHPKADSEAIQAAYERLRERYAPERLDGAAEELVELARQRRAAIEQAYAVLSDPDQRREYDANEGQSATDDTVAHTTALPEQSPAVNRPAAVARRLTDEDLIDYRPLPPAHRQERPKGFDVQPKLTPATAVARKAGRAVSRTTEQPVWMVPVLVASGLAAIIATVSFIAAGLGIPDTDSRTSAAPVAAATAQAALSPTEGLITSDEVINQFEPLIPPAQETANSAPQNPQSWVNLGNLLYDSVQVVREIMPDSVVYQQRLPRWLEASEAYSKALELQPDNASVRSDRGVSLCYYGAGNNDQSYVLQGLEEAERAAQQADSDPRVLFNLGVCQSSTDPPQIDQALATWRQVAAMATDAPALATQAQRLIDQYSQQ